MLPKENNSLYPSSKIYQFMIQFIQLILFYYSKDKIYFSDLSSFGRFIKLQEDFGFYCTCPACVDDNDPVYDAQMSKILCDFITAFNQNSHDYNFKQLRKQYDYIMKLLKKNDAKLSSSELSDRKSVV